MSIEEAEDSSACGDEVCFQAFLQSVGSDGLLDCMKDLEICRRLIL